MICFDKEKITHDPLRVDICRQSALICFKDNEFSSVIFKKIHAVREKLLSSSVKTVLFLFGVFGQKHYGRSSNINGGEV